MGERADGHEVDAGLGVGADGGERHAAGCLELGAAGDGADRLAHLLGAHVVEEDPRRSGFDRLEHLLERLRLDLHREACGVAVEGGERLADAARDTDVVLLDEDAVVETGAVVRAAAAADGVLLERAEPRRRLPRVEDLRAGAVGQLDEAACERRDPAEPAEQVERDTLAAEDRAGGAGDLGKDYRDVCDRGALLELRLERHGGVERAEDRVDDRNAADDARLLEQQLGATARVLGNERLRRGVAAAEILGESRGDDAVDVLRGQLHRSSAGSRPGWTTKWPASSPLSTGKSSRKWTPRLSSRASPDAATRRASGCGASSRRVRPGALRISPASRHSASPGISPSSDNLSQALSKAGPSSAARPARRPKTRHSRREFEASRFAPWTPVAAHSPAAKRPGRVDRPSRSVRMPPIV